MAAVQLSTIIKIWGYALGIVNTRYQFRRLIGNVRFSCAVSMNRSIDDWANKGITTWLDNFRSSDSINLSVWDWLLHLYPDFRITIQHVPSKRVLAYLLFSRPPSGSFENHVPLSLVGIAVGTGESPLIQNQNENSSRCNTKEANPTANSRHCYWVRVVTSAIILRMPWAWTVKLLNGFNLP